MTTLHSAFSIVASSLEQEQKPATGQSLFISDPPLLPSGKFENRLSFNSIAKGDDVTTSAQTPAALPALSEPVLPVDSLARLLARAATSDAGIVTYAPQADISSPTRTTYRSLFETAKEKARLLHHIDGISPSSIVLIHFDNHADNIVWFWAVTLAGYLPAISTPLANDTVQRKRHLSHLHVLLKDPIVLTANSLLPDFLDHCELRLQPVELLALAALPEKALPDHDSRRGDDLAVLMLTSGSTGNAKAVGLRHGQILTSMAGKSEHHGVGTDDTFLNWIGMDHVANLTEVHLQAMNLSAEQVHVQATDLLADPMKFLHLLSKHKVAYTFGPNFFLGRLRDTIASSDSRSQQFDLSHLRAFISGGESNVVETCAALTQQLQLYGVDGDVIRPGFGMTETCAGSIYSRSCPSYDQERRLEFACLGSCVPGIQMRVVDESGAPTAAGEVGDLQVTGPIVFREYFNNPEATKAAFSSDGWFMSGDRAYLDADSNLNLTGRSKDTIITNGVKFSSHEIETAIEEEHIAVVAPSFTVAFPHRPQGSETERIVVVYSSECATNDHATRFEATNAIAKITGLTTGAKPYEVFPLPKANLEKTSLGKISRTKVKKAYEAGEFSTFQAENTQSLEAYRASTWRTPTTSTEKSLTEIFSGMLEIPAPEIDASTSIFELGITSFNLIAVKSQIQRALAPDRDLPFGILLSDPTIAGIGAAIDTELSKPRAYDPVVPLQTQGHKTPLWCVHPGSGDILVFIALSQQFTDRPVYALRTRGYNPGETFFSGPAEAADTYTKHIKLTQPLGPYAIAGYSLGSTLGFEVAKRLRQQGDQVQFLASIDYPPFISGYVRHLNWIDVLLHIAFFLELIDEPTMVDITPTLHAQADNRDAALDFILGIADPDRVHALAVDRAKLALISDIAEAFRVGVVDYEPTPGVEQMDVFVADPPTYAAKDRQDWRDNRLGRWCELSEERPVFHDCEGIHAKMLNKEFIGEFVKKLKAAMRRRGV